MRKLFTAVALAAILAGGVWATPLIAGHGKGQPGTTTVVLKGHQPITICHRTGSATHPYVVITIDVDALKAHQTHPPKNGHYDVIPAPPGATKHNPGPCLSGSTTTPSTTTSTTVPTTTTLPTTTTTPPATTVTVTTPATTIVQTTTLPGKTTTVIKRKTVVKVKVKVKKCKRVSPRRRAPRFTG